MTLKGWVKVQQTPERDTWLNSWFPKVQFGIGRRGKPRILENTVSVIKTVGGWWQVWASSAPVSEIGSAKTKSVAVKKAVAFMKKYPGGHPSGQPRMG